MHLIIKSVVLRLAVLVAAGVLVMFVGRLLGRRRTGFFCFILSTSAEKPW